jgi:glyoxylase-like metal-dependent hydrolase (beta-lactamase superfamily II)/rhodanese-related sulfurtransferase
MFRQLFDPVSFTYTYLIADDTTHEAVLIDPVLEQVERDTRLLREHGLTLRYTVETHVHADHITGALAIKQATGAQSVVARDCNAAGYDRYLVDGDVVLFGREEILAIATPGHTPGSISYLWRDRVFTGDTLLIGGCGRTDFQNGSAVALYRSITGKLFKLDDHVLVYPGHDYKGRRVSSIGEERQFNARVAGKSAEEFVELMGSLGLPVPKRIHEAVPANLTGGIGRTPTAGSSEEALSSSPTAVRNVSPLQLAEVAAAGSVQILDVRTPAEFASIRIPGSFNVPLDRLDTDLLKSTLGVDAELYIICQTGTRSQLVADMLRTSGFQRIVHVDGGTNAWVAAGLTAERSATNVMSLERQVRVAAGTLVLVCVIGGALLHPIGYWFAAAVGGGLAYAGLSNSCGLAVLLARLPWNQPRAREVAGVQR